MAKRRDFLKYWLDGFEFSICRVYGDRGLYIGWPGNYNSIYDSFISLHGTAVLENISECRVNEIDI